MTSQLIFGCQAGTDTLVAAERRVMSHHSTPINSLNTRQARRASAPKTRTNFTLYARIGTLQFRKSLGWGQQTNNDFEAGDDGCLPSRTPMQWTSAAVQDELRDAAGKHNGASCCIVLYKS